MYVAFFVYVALFYYTVGNISPKHRSNLKFVQLLAILKSNQLKKYGISAVLQSFMDDLNQLESVSNICYIQKQERKKQLLKC